MSFRSLLTLLLLTLAGAASAASAPAPAKTSAPAKTAAAATDTATFAMGCFWSAEYAFEQRPGVLSVVSGFSGGSVKNPSYEDVCSGYTGHLEAVNVVFDPKKTTYPELLRIFWHNIDPMQSSGQFCDHGAQYHTAVFAHGATQRQQAEDSKRLIEKSGILKAPIVTVILPATPFYAAEEYHQDFWRKDPGRYKPYRLACGKDARLEQIWGSLDAHAAGLK